MTRRYFHDLFGGEAQPGDIADFVLLTNNPLSAERLARQMESARQAADHYEFQAYTGTWQGQRISLCSTGLGGGSASIALDVLATLGGRTFIYFAAGLRASDTPRSATLAVATAAIRLDGASLDYVPADYPALAHPDILQAILAAAHVTQTPAQTGLFLAHAGPIAPEQLAVFDGYNRQQAQSERFGHPIVPSTAEVGTLMALATAYGLRLGACQMTASTRGEVAAIEDRLMGIALQAAAALRQWDPGVPSGRARVVTPRVSGAAEAP